MGEDLDEGKQISQLWEKLKTNHLGKRLGVAFLVLIVLAAFIHFREVKVDLLEVNGSSKNFVVAQVDFSFPDEEETLILRQEGLRDIGSIYMLSPDEVRRVRYAFEDFLIHDGTWRHILPNRTFEEVYKAADALQGYMIRARFTDIRTINRMESLRIDTSEYFTYRQSDDGLNYYLPEDFWQSQEKDLLKGSDFHQDTLNYIIAYFSGAKWALQKDPNVERHVKQILEKEIPESVSKIKAGTRIIDRGDKVSKRHIVLIRAMKSALNSERNLTSPLTILSSFIYALLVVWLIIAYFKINQRRFLENLQQVSLYATIVVLLLVLSKATEFFLLDENFAFFNSIRFPIFVPFAAILITVLLNAEIAIVTTCLLSIVMGLSLSVEHSSFIVSNLSSGIVAILCARGLRRRKEVFNVSIKVWLTLIPVLSVFSFGTDEFWDMQFITDLLSSAIFMLAISILVVGLLPILESLFGIMTDITLMEYMDPNNELLRRLSLEAPGTYQHCLVVGSLAEAAAGAIGANGLFCRVSALYHDIGKLFNPHYFTENQMGGFNIHQLLTPVESAQVIIAHVVEGEALARKHGLPASFIDVIRQHHGTTLVYYFYCKQVEQMGGDVDAVDEKQFRYPGPTPSSRENAVMMIADTIEAASRSLEEVDENTITELVDRLIQDKAEEGQFDHCQLTFEELRIVKETMIKTLAITRHLRIKYPNKH